MYIGIVHVDWELSPWMKNSLLCGSLTRKITVGGVGVFVLWNVLPHANMNIV